MRGLSDGEVLTLANLLKMEKDGLAVARTTQTLITDDNLKKQAESAVMAAEGRVKGIQQFINENNITNTKGAE
ncbi:MAG: hypothetical protein FH762_15725 [Firmicutes bacterium]|nr:hypothetical protein [Bacillota bacterium]